MSQENEALLSVIVPVYNAEKTLQACADSILTQDYPNLELILADDSSKDGSLALCRAIAEKDSRVHVLPLEKGGVSMTRNAALRSAKGEWIMFADSDDTLVPGACRHMIGNIGDCDLMIAHYYFVLGKSITNRGLLSDEKTLEEQEFLMTLLQKPGSFYFSALWNKLYRADIIRAQNIAFDPYLNWGEDFAFNMLYNHAVRRVRITCAPIYNYNKSMSGTSIRALSRPLHNCTIKARLYQYFKKLYMDKGLYEENRQMIQRYIYNVTLAD